MAESAQGLLVAQPLPFSQKKINDSLEEKKCTTAPVWWKLKKSTKKLEVERSKTTLISPIYINEGSEEWKFNQRLNPFSIENKVIRRHWVLRIIKSFTHLGFKIFTKLQFFF